MRRIITFVSAVALATGLLTGVASAEDVDPVLAELQEAYDTAQDEVERLEGVVGQLEADLAAARIVLADAIEARDAKADEVDQLEAELATAEGELAAARATQATIEGLLAGLGDTYKDGDCNNRDGGKATCEQYLRDLATAVADVAQKLGAVEDAEGELEVAEGELEELEAAVREADDEVSRLEGELEVAQDDLEAAETVRDEAKQALDSYVPPVLPDAAEHAGCKGIENARQQVAKSANGKGKAAHALASVAQKFDCAA